VKGLDPAAEGFEPSMATHDRLRVYVLKGKRTLLAWCRDSKNDWMTELRDGQKPETLRGVTVDLGSIKARSAWVYDPWTNKRSKVAVRGGKVRLPEFSRSIVVRAQ
jgi:hypothetical protein